MDQPVFIVTGASYGLGAAVAAIAAAKGAKVMMAARTRSLLDKEASAITQNGGTVCVVEGDVSQYPDCQKIISQTIQEFGRIDALINNAAIIGPFGIVAEVEPAEWARNLEVNLFGPMMMCHEAIPYLRRSKGRVVNISSGAGVTVIPSGSAYCTAKAALTHFSRILAAEEPDIITLSFDPGSIDTQMQEEIREKGTAPSFAGFRQYFIDLYESGQLIPPEKSASAAVALAYRAPGEWTGQFITCDDERLQGILD